MLVLAAILLVAATTGLSGASTDPGEDDAGNSIAGERLALGNAQAAVAGRRVHGLIGHARAIRRGRKPSNGVRAPSASAPGLVTAAPAPSHPTPSAAPVPAPEATPGPPSGSVPPLPSAPGPVTAAPAAPEPAPPLPEPTPPPPAPAPPLPAPEPEEPEPEPEESEPEPSPPPQTSTPDISPGVPLEPAPSPAGDLVAAIDGGYAGWSSTETTYRAQLGAAVTRHEWDPLDPVDAQDEEVQIAAEQIRTRIHALLGANQLGDATHYRDWVVAFVRRYGPGGSFWAEHPHLDASRYAITTIELGNEPYFGTMSEADYADTVRPTLERIDELGLPVKVALPVYLHGEDVSWIDTLFQRIPNLNSLFDAFAFHPYWYGHHPATPGDSGAFERIGTLRRRMDELGATSKPIYLTEYGESTANCGSECVSEAVQAEHLSEMIAAVASRPSWDVEMLSVFQLLDRGTDSTNRELQFGLLREDGSPKPSYAIVRAAMQLYR